MYNCIWIETQESLPFYETIKDQRAMFTLIIIGVPWNRGPFSLLVFREFNHLVAIFKEKENWIIFLVSSGYMNEKKFTILVYQVNVELLSKKKY